MSRKPALLIEKLQNGYMPPKTNAVEIAVYDYLQEFEHLNVDEGRSDLSAFLKNKTVFLTGGTGFLGKLMLEKLLRSSGDVETIYVLVRPKKGADIQERVDKVLDDELFSKLATIRPEFRKKVVAIKGDLSLPRLGLSRDDRRLLVETVQVVYHSAATTKFDEHIRRAVDINVKGTEEMMKLARECERLESFVHLSTAFSNCWSSTIAEQFYEPLMPAEEIYDVVEGNSDEQLAEMTPRLIGDMPNTYTFTKQIGEDVVRRLGAGLPVCVVRPSIVMGTKEEPLKGWMDNIYGPAGHMIGATLGLLHLGIFDPEKVGDVVPVDYVTNACIAASHHTAKNCENGIKIFNCVSGRRNPMTWGTYAQTLKTDCQQISSVKLLWYPFFFCTTSIPKYRFISFFLNLIPAFLGDIVLKIMGKQPMLFKTCKKIDSLVDYYLAYFPLRQWDMVDDNTRKLYEDLSEVDKRFFNFNVDDLNWTEYIVRVFIGMRVFIIKDPLTTLEAGWRRRDIFKVLHYTLTIFLSLLVLRYVYLFGLLFYGIIF